MPLVRIDLLQGKSAEYRRAIGDGVLEALTATFNVPPDDRFQIITEHAPDNFIVDHNYLGIRRSTDCVIIQLTVSDTRTADQKRALYKAIADNLNRRLALRREDVFINLLEVRVENWSFGNGEAQYAPGGQ
jgi:phenylpyruvate tautomerase PptA (4-oxalocrotonate tautomerase family)